MTARSLIFIGAVLPHAWHGPGRAVAQELAKYVGRTVCLQCHGTDRAARACEVEPIAEHADAYAALTRPEAAHIAALSGVVGSPTDSRICLECHSTAADAGRRWTDRDFRFEDGVQCEACHDAGSLHVSSYATQEEEQSVKHTGRLRRGDRQSCDHCHMDRASHDAVLKEGYRLSPSDRLYKTPVNLALSPDGRLLYVVCEHSDSLIVVDTDDVRVVGEIRVGSRPQDVAVSPDGRTLYVTNRFGASLTVIDAESSEVVAEISVGGQPHGVLTDRTGNTVFTMSTEQNSISVIDAINRRETSRLSAGAGPWSVALTPDGRTLFVTSILPNPAAFREPPRSELTVVDVERGFVKARPIAADANMLQGIAYLPQIDGALFTMMRSKNLVPLTRLGQGWAITNGLGVLWSDGHVDQVLLDEPNNSLADLTDVDVSPDGRLAFVASGGADQVAVVDVGALLSTIQRASAWDRANVLPNHLGLSERFVLQRIPTGANPRAVAVSPDGRFVYVANALDDSVSIIAVGELTVVGAIGLHGPAEVTEIRRGERLFHSARITFGGQFSCRSCHPDGHVNGLTFDIEADGIGMHPLDNRTLRGILDTAPFKWEGTNPSLRRQCGPRLAVFFTRLAPFTPKELDALTRYIATIERPPNHHRHPDGLTVAQRRGKLIFERTTANNGTALADAQRCDHCHYGGYKTSRRQADVGTALWFDALVDFGLEDLFDTDNFGELGNFYFADVGVAQRRFDIPHLNNIYDSSPYLHNGAAATLEEIWTRFNIAERHGRTNDLTRRQFNDLIEYLKAL